MCGVYLGGAWVSWRCKYLLWGSLRPTPLFQALLISLFSSLLVFLSPLSQCTSQDDLSAGQMQIQILETIMQLIMPHKKKFGDKTAPHKEHQSSGFIALWFSWLSFCLCLLCAHLLSGWEQNGYSRCKHLTQTQHFQGPKGGHLRLYLFVRDENHPFASYFAEFSCLKQSLVWVGPHHHWQSPVRTQHLDLGPVSPRVHDQVCWGFRFRDWILGKQLLIVSDIDEKFLPLWGEGKEEACP